MEKNESKPFEEFKVNNRQNEIIKALIEQSFSTKNLANMYIGALKVLVDDSNPDRIHQSAHSLRELVYYMTDHIKVATKTNETHKEQMKQLISQFDELGGVNKEIIVKQWYDLHDYFVNLCHHRSKSQIKDFKDNLLKLENVLFSLLGPVYETIEELDRLIGIEDPSKEDMELVKSLLKKQTHYRYFFKNLHYPNWIELLVENDFFNIPPQKGEYSVEPLYLTKIVDKKYQEVIEIIKKLSKTTHEGAQVEFIKALLKAPIKNTLKLKKTLKRWIANAQSGYFALSKQIILYIKKLFEENEVDIAFEIVNAILAIREHQTSENNQSQISYDMNYSVEGYFYGEIIKELLPELKHNNPLQSLKLLSKKLSFLIVKELESTDESIKGENDLSLNWRRLIDEHDYYTYKKDIKNVLVSAIRDLMTYIGNEQNKYYTKAIDILRENDYLIFRRLELHIIKNFPKISENYVSEAISNNIYFQELESILEFYQLLKDCFPNVKQEIQERYLKWISNGPDIERYKQSYEKNWGKSPSEEDIASYIQYWSKKKIAPIKEHISDELITKYKIKEAEVEHLDPFKHLQRVKIGPRSPIKEEKLENMSIQEILKYVKDYQEPEHSLTFSKIGLGRTLSNVVEKKPDEFTEILPEFLKFPELHKYISYLLNGFDVALKNKINFEWDSIISLCKAVLIHNDDQTEISKEPIFYKENTLRDIKTSIGWLFRNGLSDNENSIPFSFKDDIFEILKVLTNDDEPTLEAELKSIKGNWNIRDMSINSVRGIAMNRIIDFGLWNAKHSYDENTLSDISKSKLNDQVKTILKTHLDYIIDPSFTIRYIYGFNLNRLIYLDKSWVIENLKIIFPEERDKQEYWEAAWSGYLDGNFFNLVTYKILRDQYNRGLDCFNGEEIELKLFNFSTERLANEIMRMYINGIEDLRSESSLVFKFFQKASDDVRKIGIAFIGQNLSSIKDLEDYDLVLKRLMELWEERLLVIKNSGVDNYKRELVFFLFWFKNSIFDKKWTILKLEEILDLTDGSIDAFSDVLDTFLDYIDEFPLNVINCIEKIIKNQVGTDGYLLFEANYEPILKDLLQSEDQDAKDKTRNLINFLGSRDLHYFRELLN